MATLFAVKARSAARTFVRRTLRTLRSPARRPASAERLRRRAWPQPHAPLPALQYRREPRPPEACPAHCGTPQVQLSSAREPIYSTQGHRAMWVYSLIGNTSLRAMRKRPRGSAACWDASVPLKRDPSRRREGRGAQPTTIVPWRTRGRLQHQPHGVLRGAASPTANVSRLRRSSSAWHSRPWRYASAMARSAAADSSVGRPSWPRGRGPHQSGPAHS